MSQSIPKFHRIQEVNESSEDHCGNGNGSSSIVAAKVGLVS